MSRVIIFFAQGLEECEGLIVVDLLRRAKIDVDIAAVSDKLEIVSSHGVKIIADMFAEDASVDDYDACVLPGGMPGTENLKASDTVRDFACKLAGQGKYVCAICAAPSALAAFGLLRGRHATVYPGFESALEEGGAKYAKKPVIADGNIITGEGLGAAIPFAAEIIAALKSRKKADKVLDGIVYRK